MKQIYESPDFLETESAGHSHSYSINYLKNIDKFGPCLQFSSIEWGQRSSEFLWKFQEVLLDEGEESSE